MLKILRNTIGTPNSAPSVPQALNAVVEGDTVVLSWDAADDAQTPSAALTYNLRVGTTPGGCEVISPHSSAAGYRRLPWRGNTGQARSMSLRALTPGTTYYWAVQSVDSAFAGSSFAAEGSFTITAAAARNVGFAREADGYHVVWRGTPTAVYQVEISEDLANWSPLTTATAATETGLFEVTDKPPATVSQRFYRASLPTVSNLSRSTKPSKKATAHAHPRRRR
jgi:hypothetical protein